MMILSVNLSLAVHKADPYSSLPFDFFPGLFLFLFLFQQKPQTCYSNEILISFNSTSTERKQHAEQLDAVKKLHVDR